MADDQRPQKKPKTPPAGAPAWMVTFSDMVTLLLTFFVLLLSMANMDPVKFLSASTSIKDSFGIHPSPSRTDFSMQILSAPPINKFSPVSNPETQRLYRKIKSEIDTRNLSQDVDVELHDNDTVILRIKDDILFDAGETQVAPESYPLLRFIADIIRPLPYNLRIDGHTDTVSDTPVQIEKWDVSMARAVSVLRFLKKGDLLPIDRMSASAYGAEKPVASNDTEDGQAKNRRVEFILRSNKSAKTSQPESNSKGATIPF